MENSNYLGTEKVGKLLQKFAIPCIFSLIISCLYNIVDQIFVGNGVGYLGNAATGVIFPITVVGWGLSLFFGDGAAAALSVSLGRGETKDIHRSVGSAALGSFFSGVMVIAIAYLWGDGLLRLIGATDANIQMAHEYGVIIFAMMPLAMTQNTLASIIRADGSPRYAMMAMLTGTQPIVTCVQKVCAIIGRSADYVLRNYPDVVRICIYAPESYREKKVMEDVRGQSGGCEKGHCKVGCRKAVFLFYPQVFPSAVAMKWEAFL